MDEERNFPTMIIPAGAEIGVNQQGQLSIRTPGNLVIQNSGTYSIIESARGSVRIDPTVQVEAVSIQAADSCFIAGELTAWRVKAKKIILERGAQAYIMLQESESLELDRNARLVGNFASQKELYLMLGRFSRQLRQLPQGLGEEQRRGSASWLPQGDDEPFVAPDGEDELGRERQQQRGEVLSLVRVLLERELGRGALEDGSRGALEQLVALVREGDHERLAEAYRYLLSQVENPSDDLQQAKEMLGRLFQA